MENFPEGHPSLNFSTSSTLNFSSDPSLSGVLGQSQAHQLPLGSSSNHTVLANGGSTTPGRRCLRRAQTLLPSSRPDSAASVATTFSSWPSSQHTHDVVVNRLVGTLSATSVLSKRYNTLSSDEDFVVAHQMEDEAFSSATVVAAASTTDAVETLRYTPGRSASAHSEPTLPLETCYGTHGDFSVLWKPVIECFPLLYISQPTATQELVANDLCGYEWFFKHVYLEVNLVDTYSQLDEVGFLIQSLLLGRGEALGGKWPLAELDVEAEAEGGGGGGAGLADLEEEATLEGRRSYAEVGGGMRRQRQRLAKAKAEVEGGGGGGGGRERKREKS
ncbi:hypothetical protein Fmac_007843 [Flemingia macrophylla]|uniref:WPP domain-containing protein n=1 Tax=Flemingia macrophylla TaxID=520843 RepID=A0ABD1MWU7_9FABA